MVLRIVSLLLLIQISQLQAQSIEGNVLSQCRAQSQTLDQVHACMDGYLDISDANISALTDFLQDFLGGDSLSGLLASQQAFAEYRRQNCLWYLRFSTPRSEAEQIAKQCLVDMSDQRLKELRRLVVNENDTVQSVQGFYVYGADRNSFQPCGSEQRYWVEGAADVVGLIQQTYLSIATGQRQLLHATLVGKVETQAQSPASHSGVFQLSDLIELRVPTDIDCQLASVRSNLDIGVNDVSAPLPALEVADDQIPLNEEPEQQLTAYFGDWVVNCVELAQQKQCALDVDLLPNGYSQNASSEENLPNLTLHRSAGQSSYLELFFPEREIDSPTLIRWAVDNLEFGDILGAQIRVDQLGARELVSESRFLNTELLPTMIEGIELKVQVLNNVDDAQGELFLGTLRGLTKALSFADDFVQP